MHESSLFEAHEISAGEIYRDDLVQVTAAENSHYDLMPDEQRKQLKSFAFRIKTADAVIVVTGDTGRSDAVTQAGPGRRRGRDRSDGRPSARVA